MVKLETPKQRLFFAIACLWFIGWTIAYVMSGIYSPYGFKPDGWFMFAVLPILVAYGFYIGVARVSRWVRSGS